MTTEMLFVFGLLLVTVILFASDRIRLDVVAILVILALMLSGTLGPKEALAGFGDPVVLLIAGLFVVGEGLFRTGIAYAIGDWLMRVAGTSETRLLVLLMLVVALLSAFMSSTGAVAIFIPIALSLAAKAGIGPPRLMMPLSIAALIGGMLTLIGTPPNLVVSTELERQGLEPFNFFSFTPVGLLVLAASIGFILLVGRRLLPAGVEESGPGGQRLTLQDLVAGYGLSGQFHRLRVRRSSDLVGQTVADALLRTRYDVTVIGIERHDRFAGSVMAALADTVMQSDDILYVVGQDSAVAGFEQAQALERLPIADAQVKRVKQELGLAEVMLPPSSELIGRTLKEAAFRSKC